MRTVSTCFTYFTYLRGVVVQVAPQQPHRLEQGEGRGRGRGRGGVGSVGVGVGVGGWPHRLEQGEGRGSLANPHPNPNHEPHLEQPGGEQRAALVQQRSVHAPSASGAPERRPRGEACVALPLGRACSRRALGFGFGFGFGLGFCLGFGLGLGLGLGFRVRVMVRV